MWHLRLVYTGCESVAKHECFYSAQLLTNVEVHTKREMPLLVSASALSCARAILVIFTGSRSKKNFLN